MKYRSRIERLVERAWDIVTDNAAVENRLASYHFTQHPEADVSADPETRYRNPGNDPLRRLFDASTKAGNVRNECAKAVLYGDYLHAFKGTFAHLRYGNRSFPVNGGLGHAVYGHFPDHTYNETEIFGRDWNYNQDRPLEMEHEVFAICSTNTCKIGTTRLSVRMERKATSI
jgi:hypothetical protein